MWKKSSLCYALFSRSVRVRRHTCRRDRPRKYNSTTTRDNQEDVIVTERSRLAPYDSWTLRRNAKRGVGVSFPYHDDVSRRSDAVFIKTFRNRRTPPSYLIVLIVSLVYYLRIFIAVET